MWNFTGGANDRKLSYRCNLMHDDSNIECPHPSILTKWMEAAVFEIVKLNLLTKENLQLISNASRRVGKSDPPDIFGQQLLDIRKKIARAKTNLALAESNDDFSAVSSVIQDLRKQEDGILSRIKKSRAPSKASPETLEVITKCLNEKQLEDADPTLLKVALAKCIKKITFGRRVIRPHQGLEIGTYPEGFGFLQFSEDVFSGGEIELSPDLLNRGKKYRAITNYICAHPDREFSIAEIREIFVISDTVARQHLYKAMASDKVQKNGCRRGWQAISCPDIHT